MSTTSVRRPVALVFDLWKTLIPLPDEIKQAAYLAAAEALGEAPDVLLPAWQATRVERETGPFDTYLRRLRGQLDRQWSDQMLATVAAERLRIHGAMFDHPTPGAVEVLTWAKASELPVAVVSNGSSDVRMMFDSSDLAELVDVLILSAEVGIMKPAPEIFRLAVERLKVRGEGCVYVGDGQDQELDGASAVGMTAVLLDIENDHPWAGARIHHLSDLVPRAASARCGTATSNDELHPAPATR